MTTTKNYTIQVRKSSGNDLVVDGTFTTIDNLITSFNIGNTNVLIPNVVGTYGNNVVTSPFSNTVKINGRDTYYLRTENQYNSNISGNDPFFIQGDKQFSFGGICLDNNIPYFTNLYPDGTSPLSLFASMTYIDQNGENFDTGSNNSESILTWYGFGVTPQGPPSMLTVKVFITFVNTTTSSSSPASSSSTNFNTDFAILEKVFQPDYSDMKDDYLTTKAYVDFKNTVLNQDISKKSNDFMSEIKGITGLETIPQQYDTVKEMALELLNLGDSDSPSTVYYNLLSSYAQGVTDRQNKVNELNNIIFFEQQRATIEEGVIKASIESEISSFNSSLNAGIEERKAADIAVSVLTQGATQARINDIVEEKKSRENGDTEFRAELNSFKTSNDSKFQNIAYDNNSNIYSIESNLSLLQNASNDLSLQLSSNFRIAPSSDFKSLKFQHRNGLVWVDVCALNSV
jgi:hypothetical protein